MNKEFVPHEQALALKELGFDEPCMCFYNNRKELKVYHNVDKDWNTLEHQLLGNSKITLPNTYSAPTYSQAFRWFREKYDLKSFIQPLKNDDDIDIYVFAYGIEEIEHNNLDYLIHEEAELECLKKLIEIVKFGNYGRK
jgi:hypothetical protein